MQTKHPLCRKGPPAESMWDFYEKCAFKDQDFCRRPTLFYAETRPRWSAYGQSEHPQRLTELAESMSRTIADAPAIIIFFNMLTSTQLLTYAQINETI